LQRAGFAQARFHTAHDLPWVFFSGCDWSRLQTGSDTIFWIILGQEFPGRVHGDGLGASPEFIGVIGGFLLTAPCGRSSL
jgi:hypothetical protein